MSTEEDGSSQEQRVGLMRLVPEDWHLWRSLRLQALTEAPHAFGSTLQEWQGPGDTEARWRNRLATVPLNLVASVNGEFVGMVGATEKNEDGIVELISLWVAPAGRGRGIGDLMVDAVIAWAQQLHALHVALSVKVDNEHAKALYLRRGFVDVGASLTQDIAAGAPERRWQHTCSKAGEFSLPNMRCLRR